MKMRKFFLLALVCLAMPLSALADYVPLITSVDQLYSPNTRSSDGDDELLLSYLIDGDSSTTWKSESSASSDRYSTEIGSYYIRVELMEQHGKLAYLFTRRNQYDDYQITKMSVYAATDDTMAKEDCEYITTLDLPFTTRGETLTGTFDSEGYTFLRFYFEEYHDGTHGNTTYIAEFQLYDVADDDAGDDTSITNKKIASISDAITTQPEEGKWYLIMNNRGGTMTPAGDTGEGGSITRASSADAVTEGMAAEEVAEYLLSFTPTGQTSSAGVGGVYTLQWATGNYWKSIYDVSQGTAVTTSSDASEAGAYNVYPTATGGSTFGLNAYDMNKRVDNNGVGEILTGWDSGQNTATSGNNVWWLYEVELAEMSAEEMELLALIKEAEADYALYDGKLDTGFSSGDGVGNGLIKSTSQFSSPYTEPNEGSLDNLLDNDASTFWHSVWSSGSVDDGIHYLQVDMADDFNGGDVVLNLIRRTSNNDHVTAMSVKDGDDVEIVPTFEIPFSGSGATDQVAITIPEGNKTLRFYEQATTNTNGYWHVGDFQLFDASYLHPDYNNTNPDVAEQLTAAIAAANEAIASGEVLQSDIDALQAAIDYYLDNIDPYKLDPGTVVHECGAELADWTTTGNNGSHELNTWSTEADASGMVPPFCQNWVASSSSLTAATISHNTLTDLISGYYLVTLDARIFSEAGNAIAAGTTLSANGEAVDLVATGTSATYGTETEVYGGYAVAAGVTDGTLDISLNIPSGVSYNWLAWKNLSVTYYGDELPAIAAVEGTMNAAVSETMATALAAYGAENTPANYNAALTAVRAAEKSAEYYAGIATIVESLDEAGQAAFAATSEGEAYAALALDGDDITATLVEAQKAQTTPGSDLSLVATSDGSWVNDTGTYGEAVERYVGGTTAAPTEGFTEGMTLYKEITGLTPGVYTVTFYAVANSTNERDDVDAATGDGVTEAFANDATDGVTVGTDLACVPSDYPYTLTCTVGDDGTLRFGLQNVAMGGNWYVCQAVSLTLVELTAEEEEEDLTELIAKYEADLAEAAEVTAGLEEKIAAAKDDEGYDSTILANMEEALAGLQEVVGIYGNIDTTDTTADELTEAIEAIESALASAQDALATGLNGVTATTGNDVIYTIGGVRVSDTGKPGVYIVNGKKVMVK